LKIRLRELLCIHGLKEWSPKLASHQRLLGFNEALICLSYSGLLAHGDFLCAEMVVRRGNAPRSLAYQASALLLSYRTEKVNREAFEGTPPDVRLIFQSKNATRAIVRL
jgi:hypothetical protein